jgi:hypothetical protein
MFAKNDFDLVVYSCSQEAIAETTVRGATQVATPKQSTLTCFV